MRDLAAIWLYVADSSCRGYSPVYDRICRVVAQSDKVLDLVSEAPPRGHNPLLFNLKCLRRVRRILARLRCLVLTDKFARLLERLILCDRWMR